MPLSCARVTDWQFLSTTWSALGSPRRGVPRVAAEQLCFRGFEPTSKSSRMRKDKTGSSEPNFFSERERVSAYTAPERQQSTPTQPRTTTTVEGASSACWSGATCPQRQRPVSEVSQTGSRRFAGSSSSLRKLVSRVQKSHFPVQEAANAAGSGNGVVVGTRNTGQSSGARQLRKLAVRRRGEARRRGETEPKSKIQHQ